MMARTCSMMYFLVVVIFSSSHHEAYAAFWDRPKPKTDQTAKKTSETSSSEKAQSEKQEPQTQEEIGAAKKRGASKVVKAVTPVQPVTKPADIRQVEQELKGIIDRTRTLETQAVADRAEIEQMLKRAQIHEQILRTMKIPEPVHTVTPVDTNRILQQEKIRLISEQAQRTQRTLEILQRTAASGTHAPAAPSEKEE